MVSARAVADRKIVDAGNAQPHQAVLGELPILVAKAAEPVPAVVVPLIGETNRDTVLAEGPDFLNQPVVEFTTAICGSRMLRISARPCKNTTRFRQRVSVGY